MKVKVVLLAVGVIFLSGGLLFSQGKDEQEKETPPGWDEGLKEGWEKTTPPGWDKWSNKEKDKWLETIKKDKDEIEKEAKKKGWEEKEIKNLRDGYEFASRKHSSEKARTVAKAIIEKDLKEDALKVLKTFAEHPGIGKDVVKKIKEGLKGKELAKEVHKLIKEKDGKDVGKPDKEKPEKPEKEKIEKPKKEKPERPHKPPRKGGGGGKHQ